MRVVTPAWTAALSVPTLNWQHSRDCREDGDGHFEWQHAVVLAIIASAKPQAGPICRAVNRTTRMTIARRMS